MMMSVTRSIKRILLICMMVLMTIPPAISVISQGYVLKEAYYVPQNEEEYEELTRNIKCSQPNLKVTYLINMWKNRTITGCFPDERITGGYCAELNSGSELRVQPNYAAPCHNFTHTPCKNLYHSSQSYLIRQCFEEYGNISSPLEIFRENENLRRIENDQRKIIQTFQKQNDLLSQQMRKNVELIKIQEINITNMELIIKKLTEKVHNINQPEFTGLLSVFLFFLVQLVMIVLGNLLLFVIHKYIFRDAITLGEFCYQRGMLVKAWLFTINKQKQVLRSFILGVENEEELLRTVESDGDNDDTRECFDSTQGKNDFDKDQEPAIMIDPYHHENNLNPEEADELCQTVTHITRNEDEPEISQYERENASEQSILQASEKMTRKVWKDE